jgi:hypothetical protein
MNPMMKIMEGIMGKKYDQSGRDDFFGFDSCSGISTSIL